MSRSHFVLAVALVVIAATMVFVKVFPDDSMAASAGNQPHRTDFHRSDRIAPKPGRAARPITVRQATESPFHIGFDRQTLASLTEDQRRSALGYAAKAEADARATMTDLSTKYALTPAQQRNIFPIVAAHTSSYHPSMAVNGSAVIPAPADSSLEESIHGELDPDQQAVLEDSMLDDLKWWQEIASQLEDDLNGAIEAGEVTVAEPTAPVSVDTAPAEGDGEAASHSGGNIFDLLNRGN